ncbi:Splicing factor 3B subunit 2 [Geodia barretti]|uniref:Splicing factor 3B subunit 2 n=1 Tax=Geodia barretti TaxID=519541 RepID=A0AA35X342_GEOBA|nr:Splicing factor 3B subunit 2 [Geodia barretti]
MEEEEESGEDEGELKPEDLQAGLITPLEGGLVTPSGLTSIPAGMETPEMIQLRKKKIEEAMEQGGNTPALFTVLPEKTQSVGGAVMGSSHVYDLSAAVPGANKKTGGGGGEGVEVALDPSELDLDAATMTARYEEQMKETKLQKEDLSDMVAEHAAKQKKRKRTATDSSSGKASKKLKEFKF